MKSDKKWMLLQSRRGTTLVEVIVSIALIGILMVLISGLLMTGFMITKINQPKTNNIYKVGGQIATQNVPPGTTSTANSVTVSGSSGSVTVTLNGTASTISGTYQNGSTVTGTSSATAASGWSFNPNS